MQPLFQWASDWGFPYAAITDLMHRLGRGFDSPQPSARDGMSETAVQSRVRLEYAKAGVVLWRNNVGALLDSRGVPVRYGLCNDTAVLNAKIKSGDLIGIRPVYITPAMVDTIIGQFVSIECKEDGWKYSGDDHEVAQAKWQERVISLGGDAKFVSGTGSI